MRERNAERGRRSRLRIGHRQRHEPAADDVRVHRHRAKAGQFLDEAVVAARLGERARGRSGELVGRPRETDGAFAEVVRRLDDERVAELARGRRGFGGGAHGDRPRLREACGGEPLALPELRDGERRRLRLHRVRQAEPLRDARRDADGVVGAGGDEAVHVLRAREPVDGGLVLDRDDRPPVGVSESRSGRVAVGRDEGQSPPPGGGEDSELRRAGAENEQTHRPIVATGPARPPREAPRPSRPPERRPACAG